MYKYEYPGSWNKKDFFPWSVIKKKNPKATVLDNLYELNKTIAKGQIELR